MSEPAAVRVGDRMAALEILSIHIAREKEKVQRFAGRVANTAALYARYEAEPLFTSEADPVELAQECLALSMAGARLYALRNAAAAILRSIATDVSAGEPPLPKEPAR